MALLKKHFYTLMLLLIVLFGAARVMHTSTQFSHVLDEIPHIGTGMEWWQRGTYEWEALHPPLARVMVAALPYLDGVRLSESSLARPCKKTFEEFYRTVEQDNERGMFPARCINVFGIDVLYRGDYDHTLFLARLGALPFFVALMVYTYLLGADFVNKRVGLLAAGLVSFMPAILAHAFTARTDIALAATLMMACYHYLHWLSRPTIISAFWCALGVALCLLSKFSSLIFLPVVLAWLTVWHAYLHEVRLRHTAATILKSGVPVAIFGFLICWAMYHFSLGAPAAYIPALFGAEGIWQKPILPMPEMVEGVLTVMLKNARGHASYILGEFMHDRGVWYFFPVLLLFKTPVAFLLMLLGSVSTLAAEKPFRNAWIISLGAALLMLLVVMPSDINIGLRHILPVYPFFCIAAAVGMVSACQKWRRIALPASVVLGMWYAASSLGSHPDYIPYFNFLAGDKPEAIALDSDLDHQQDRNRFIAWAKSHPDRQITVCGLDGGYFRRFGYEVPNVREDCSGKVRQGWFVASLTFTRIVFHGRFDWLDAYRPVEKIGAGLNVYNLP